MSIIYTIIFVSYMWLRYSIYSWAEKKRVPEDIAKISEHNAMKTLNQNM